MDRLANNQQHSISNLVLFLKILDTKESNEEKSLITVVLI